MLTPSCLKVGRVMVVKVRCCSAAPELGFQVVQINTRNFLDFCYAESHHTPKRTVAGATE
jgi:hypothetical protein